MIHVQVHVSEVLLRLYAPAAERRHQSQACQALQASSRCGLWNPELRGDRGTLR